jgi:hypothetical protein
LVNALSKMKSKGRISVIPSHGTTKLRMVTNRPLRFGEAWSDSRSSDYNLSAVEVILTADDKNNSGTLLPACQFKIDKEGQFQIELLRNAWRLGNVRVR